MSRFGAGSEWKSRAIAALSAVALAALGTVGCSKNNATFCEDRSDCDPGQVCTENACEAGDFDAAVSEPDASPACPTDTHQCLQGPPTGWSGPTARADLSGEASAPACADAAQNGLLAGLGFDTAASCECECTTAATVVCTAATMQAREDAGLDCRVDACLNCPSQIVPADVCSVVQTNVIPGASGVISTRMYPGTIVSGTCMSGANTENFSIAEFDGLLGLCALQGDTAGCSEGSLCTLRPGTEFLDERCIFRSGEHECPAETDWVERHLTFASLTDNRSCATCTCGLPAAGTSCGGTIHECNVMGISNSQGVGCSPATDWMGHTNYEYTPEPGDVDCVPTEANPAVNGEIAGVDPITVCCTATE